MDLIQVKPYALRRKIGNRILKGNFRRRKEKKKQVLSQEILGKEAGGEGIPSQALLATETSAR
jgi:hypothetical protein